MEHKELSAFDLLIETHIGLERQGPGSPEVTEKALGFLGDLKHISRAADLGCGTGGQTLALAGRIPGEVTGVDLIPGFIEVLNASAGKLGLAGRVKGVVGSILELPFPAESMDLLWSEGVIDSIGFEKGLRYWQGFLKKGGHVAVSSPTWLTGERPAEIEKFWVDAVEGLGTVAQNIAAMQRAGYRFVAAFLLPDACWTENYFAPREAAALALREKYPGSETVEAYIADNQYEVELYAKYKAYYGYVFYIGEKV